MSGVELLRPEAVDDPRLRQRLEAEGVDRHLRCPGAAASLWWQQVPSLPGQRLGVIGHYEAVDDAAAARLLAACCEHLRAQGCSRALGPMDGSTWRRYRLVVAGGDEPRFLFEPANPPEWPGQWTAAGFSGCADYLSSMVEDLAASDPRLERVAARLAPSGLRIRALDPARFEAELDAIHDVSLAAFPANFLYTPLPRAAFAAMYRPVRALIVPELCLLAERRGRAVGYVFALPELERQRRGAAVDTVVVKTLAIEPGRDLAGLGALLVERCHHAAHAAGFRRAIHALMHQSNTSTAIARDAREIRRYRLYAKDLT